MELQQLKKVDIVNENQVKEQICDELKKTQEALSNVEQSVSQASLRLIFDVHKCLQRKSSFERTNRTSREATGELIDLDLDQATRGEESDRRSIFPS